MLKWVAVAMEGPEVKGAAAMLVGLFGLARKHKAHILVGGLRAVTSSLLRCIEHYGGTVHTMTEVTRVNVSGGRVTGVSLKSYAINTNDSKVIARHIESPLEHHHNSASMMNGDIFGISPTMDRNMGSRPIPELAQYR